MIPHTHSSNNDVLGPPVGMASDQCSPLPITRVMWTDGLQGVVSFWKPNDGELELLAKGHAVRLSFVGSVTHPPLAVGVDGDGFFELPAGVRQ